MASDAVASAERAQLDDLLSQRLPTYSRVAAGELELLTVTRRPASRLYRYAVRGAPPARLVVKVPLARLAPSSARARPRLMDPTPAAIKATLEFRALRAAEAHFAAIGDRRFSAIEALDLIHPLNALVMLEADGTSLRRVLRDALLPGRRRRSTAVLGLHTAGAWLRAYHRIVPSEGTGERLVDADAVARHLSALGEHLSNGRLGRDAAAIARRAADVARDALADGMPLAVVHGDFAMRNILLDADRRVSVLDMLGRWRAPAYEDVATLLLALDSIGIVPRFGGVLPSPGIVREARSAFISGYFEDESDRARPQLAVFGALLALDRWASLEERGRGSALLGRGLLRIARGHLHGAS